MKRRLRLIINGHATRFPQTMVDLTIDKTTDNETILLMDNESTSTITSNTNKTSETANRTEDTNPSMCIPAPATFLNPYDSQEAHRHPHPVVLNPYLNTNKKISDRNTTTF